MMGRLIYKCLGCGQVYADPNPVRKSLFIVSIAAPEMKTEQVKPSMKSIHTCNENSIGVSDLIRWDKI